MITRRQVLLGAAAVLGVSVAASTITRMTEEKRIASLVPIRDPMYPWTPYEQRMMNRYTWTQHINGFAIQPSRNRYRPSRYTSKQRHRVVRPTPAGNEPA